MAREVWKYLVPPPTGGPAAPVPRGGRIVHCGPDPATGNPAAWIEVDPSEPREQRQFVAVGTEHPIPEGGLHRGAAICGAIVWHVYETGEAALRDAIAGTF